MRLIQFEDIKGARRVGIVNDAVIKPVSGVDSMRALALLAISERNCLGRQAQLLQSNEEEDYATIRQENRLLAPLDHEDPAHCLISGNGMTHFGSASTRNRMHQTWHQNPNYLNDSMRIFEWGIESGRPTHGQIGAQPEWFYKGDGSIVVRPGASFPTPEFAEDTGEEPELVGLYIIDNEGQPHRLGFAIGNEHSDHILECRNYLYHAHSKLRYCSFGPELLVGALPSHLAGISRIRRNDRVIWEKEFFCGEDNMCHSIENLEYHHFKYNQFLRPGDVHVHFFGAATLSFSDSVRTIPGDVFEIHLPDFGEPLVNSFIRTPPRISAGGVKAL